jgi:hypothetical protein
MTPKFRISAAVAVLVAALGPPALAHHSASMYDPARQTTVSGVIKTFNWTNPHVTVEILADAKGDAPQALWTLEASSPGVMVRSGWTKRSLNPGDKVTVQFNPLRDGGLGGNLRKVVLPDGKALVWNPSSVPSAAPP